MTTLQPNERLAVLEHQVERMEEQMERMSLKVDEMHAVLLQAKGVRWVVVGAIALTGSMTAALHWMFGK